MVVTTAFGAGNNYPGVWVVILANTWHRLFRSLEELVGTEIRQCVISSLQKTYHINVTKKASTSVDARQ